MRFRRGELLANTSRICSFMDRKVSMRYALCQPCAPEVYWGWLKFSQKLQSFLDEPDRPDNGTENWGRAEATSVVEFPGFDDQEKPALS